MRFMNITKLLICLVLIHSGGCNQKGEESAPKILKEKIGTGTNYVVEGALSPSNKLSCLKIDEIENTYTPPDLFDAMKKCVYEDKMDAAVYLYFVASLYAKFDSERLNDKTAKNGIMVMQMNSVSNISEKYRERFRASLKRNREDHLLFQVACSEIKKVDYPEYYPKYLILFGLNAYKGNPYEGALKSDFEPEQVWSKIQGEFFGCDELNEKIITK